jgi:hypothetical protein
MPIGLFFVLVVILVLVLEKIELVKPVAKRIENEDDIRARRVSPAQYHQFLTTCCQKNPAKGCKSPLLATGSHPLFIK